MLACVDVDYRDPGAVAGSVLFRAWSDARAAETHTVRLAEVEEYRPGQFYRRELGCLLAVLARASAPLETVVVDGYVWLEDNRPGLGAHLYRALGRSVPVIGVAKTPYRGATAARPLLRGASRKPLFVSAAGLELAEAAANIAAMHGTHRIPTLLKQVDRLCRGK